MSAKMFFRPINCHLKVKLDHDISTNLGFLRAQCSAFSYFWSTLMTSHNPYLSKLSFSKVVLVLTYALESFKIFLFHQMLQKLFQKIILFKNKSCFTIQPIYLLWRSFRPFPSKVKPGGSNLKAMQRAEGAENLLDYLSCYICLKSCKCKPKEESKYFNISYYCS